ncbi:MAG: hypothetical protein WA989_10955 [Henriciella sp.]|uniref:hypothetical protein n=1 Tax=Henriciella sp. TaxID=1968823 RepID=UPI003C74A958
MMRWVSIAAAVAAGVPYAHAGPWLRHAEETYSRLAVTRSQIESLDALRLDTYAEHGLNERWTLTLKYERLEFDDVSQFNEDGWRVTARRGAKLTDSAVGSLEFGVLQGAAIGGAAACEAFGAEARAGIGQSIKFETKKRSIPAYWFAETAVRYHEDGCSRQRLEFGYGQQVLGDIWAISQVWLEDGSHNAASTKYQFEYLWKADRFDISVGTQTELGGQFEESAVFFAVSRVF